MDRQALTGDTVLVMSREMTGSSQKLGGWGEKGQRRQETKYIGPVKVDPHQI